MDGALYSCDFSDKFTNSSSPLPSKDFFLSLDDIVSLGKGRRATQAQSRLETARRSLKDKQQGNRALEGALRLSAPIKDDLSLAEEMSKCEGLMTRTGLKRVTAESTGLSSNVNSSVVLSIPLSKTKKSETANSSPRKATSKSCSPSRKAMKESASEKSAIEKDEQSELPLGSEKLNSPIQHQQEPQKPPAASPPSTLSQPTSASISEETMPHHQFPCRCCRSLSSVVGSNGKGWEGTATLFHGSRLRFGCLQFILSLAGRPGHNELVLALTDSQLNRGSNVL